MKNIGERIKQKRRAAGLTQLELAAKIGIKRSAVTQWELGITQPNGQNLLKLAESLSCDPKLFTNDFASAKDAPPQNTINEPRGDYLPQIIRRVPVISDIAAGLWRESQDTFHPGDADLWQDTTAKVSNQSFALRVEGKSMQNPNGNPSIPHGSIVIVDPEIEAMSGSIVVAKLPDSNRTTIKRLIYDGGDVFLEPLNPDYKTMLIDDNCIIVGVVKQVIQDI